jgi:formiminotetrahydrofolate cyclodeaminase
MPEIDEFLKELASASPVPGGGSVAGFEIAMGAALIHMVAELTVGREKFAAVELEVREIRDRAAELQTHARSLVDADVEAFSRVSEAMKLPRATDEEKSLRRQAVQDTLKGAVGPPLATMKSASDLMGLATRLAPIGNPNAISDVGSAALAIDAGYYAAKLNVEINLAAIKDEHFVQEIRGQMPVDSTIDDGRKRTVNLVLKSIRGE